MKSGAMNHYDTMNMDQLKALPINDIAAENCCLLMWWIGSMPAEALELVNSWGFTVKTMSAFVWMKQTTKLNPFFGMGFWTRAGSECCLLAVKGKPKPASHSVRSVVTDIVRKHSEKPQIIRDDIVKLCGNKPRIELFARHNTPGWDTWGNHLPNDIDLTQRGLNNDQERTE